MPHAETDGVYPSTTIEFSTLSWRACVQCKTVVADNSQPSEDGTDGDVKDTLVITWTCSGDKHAQFAEIKP